MPSRDDEGEEGQYGQSCLSAVQGWLGISQSQRSITPQLRSKHHLCCDCASAVMERWTSEQLERPGRLIRRNGLVVEWQIAGTCWRDFWGSVWIRDWLRDPGGERRQILIAAPIEWFPCDVDKHPTMICPWCFEKTWFQDIGCSDCRSFPFFFSHPHPHPHRGPRSHPVVL